MKSGHLNLRLALLVVVVVVAPLGILSFVPDCSRQGGRWNNHRVILPGRDVSGTDNHNQQQQQRKSLVHLFASYDPLPQQRQQQISSRISTDGNSPSNWIGHVLSATLAAGLLLGGGPQHVHAAAETPSTTSTTTTSTYSGFADYAKDNQMQQSDVGCFISKCGEQTKALFSNPRGIKGTTCLGQCKGEQACSTRCFSEFGSADLSNWLSCAIEEKECIKIPKATFDNSAEDVGYDSAVKSFDPTTLAGKWYKTYGLNPNYDMFDCQYNTFEPSTSDSSELDMGIFLRVSRPEEAGGGYWENYLTEHMVVDKAAGTATSSVSNENQPVGRTMHTQGKMNGLQFDENWFILGESDGTKGIPPFKLVAYKGHTLQGGYEGSFVYSREPQLPDPAIPAIREAASKAGLKWDDYRPIDNTCPAGKVLNDAEAGTGTSTKDWINLVVGEGGVIDWISPGWRGEYKNS